MKFYDVVIALEGIAEARSKWGKASAEFNTQTSLVMGRLIREAAVNKMSVHQVATAAGMTETKVRSLMRSLGLNPRDGKTLLARRAAQALQENAALLGVEPHEMDLMSPLAYLPMGSNLRQFLETPVDVDEVLGDTDPEPNVDADTEHYVTLGRLLARFLSDDAEMYVERHGNDLVLDGWGLDMTDEEATAVDKVLAAVEYRAARA